MKSLRLEGGNFDVSLKLYDDSILITGVPPRLHYKWLNSSTGDIYIYIYIYMYIYIYIYIYIYTYMYIKTTCAIVAVRRLYLVSSVFYVAHIILSMGEITR